MMLLNLLDEADFELHEYSREIPLEVETKEFSLKRRKKAMHLFVFQEDRFLKPLLDCNGVDIRSV